MTYAYVYLVVGFLWSNITYWAFTVKTKEKEYIKYICSTVSGILWPLFLTSSMLILIKNKGNKNED